MLFTLAYSIEDAAEALQHGFNGASVGESSAVHYRPQRTSQGPLQAEVNGVFYMLKNGCV